MNDERNHLEEKLKLLDIDKRKRAEDALHESEEMFRVLAETSPAAICVYQGEHNVYVNAAMTHLTGYTEQECLEMSFWDWMHEDYRELVKERGLARQRGEPVPSQYEFKCLTKNGEEKWIFVSGGRIEYKGKPAGIVTLIDITDRKRMEDELHQAHEELEKRIEERTAELMDANELLQHEIAERNQAEEALLFSRFCIDKAAIGIFETDENGTIFSVNDYARASLGYSKEELCALSVFDIDPMITGEKMSEIRKILETTGSATHETIHRRKDGTTFPVEITANLLEFHGKSFGISFVKDISERKRVEEERRKSEENFSIIFQATPDLIAITRASDGTILEVNEAFSRLLGYSRAEAIGKCTKELSIWADPADRAKWMAELVATGQVNEFETTLRCRDGSLITCVSTARPLDFGGEKCVLSVVRDITERKAAESALRLSQFIIDNASIGIMRGNDDAKILSANEHWARVLGYSQEELCTMSFFDIDPNLTPESWLELRKRLTSTGFNTFESLQRRKDGKTFPVEVTVSYLKFGEEVFGCSFVRDITERKQAEEELQLTQFCVDKASLALYQLTGEGDIWNVNECACQSLGYSMEELRSMSVFDIDPGCTREVFNDLATKLLDCGSITFERVHRRKDGTTFPVEITSNAVEFRGRTLGINFVKDITERKHAEEALRKSRQMLMSVLDNFPGVVFWKDRNSVYMGCNKNFSQAAGLSEPSEIVGKNDHELPWKNDAEWYLADDRQVIESGAPKLNIIETLLHADGRVAWFETSKIPLFDEDGKVFAVLGSSNDITERKRAEEELQKSRDDLEISVRERTEQLTSLTAELSLAEERERRRIATELHDQVGQTLILSKIKLDSLSLSLPSERFEKQIGEVNKYLDQSIQDIRSLTFQLSPPLLYEVGFEAAVEWLGEEFEEKYGFQVEFQDDGKKKSLDEEASVALFQMVRELLLNVAKHAKAKRVKISIGKVSGKIKINVADDGSGFDRLNGMRRNNKKSGFGLFNIRQRIEYLGGDLRIESEIGCGTMATLSLPLKKKEPNGKIQ